MAIRTLNKDFHYSREEVKDLARMLGMPKWDKAQDEWKGITDETTHERAKLDLQGEIARSLERIASQYLRELGVRTPSGVYQDVQWENEVDMDPKYVMETNRKIVTLAGQLHRLLSSRHPVKITFAGAFGEIHELERDQDNKLSVLNELNKIAGGFDIVQESYKTWLENRSPGFLDYVTKLRRLWEHWTDSRAGTSKGGGPAQEFVVAAANPLIRFGKASGFNVKPRNTEISVEQAGELIRQSHEKEDQEGKGRNEKK